MHYLRHVTTIDFHELFECNNQYNISHGHIKIIIFFMMDDIF